MINGMLYSSRGCIKEEMRMDIISNNLANTNVHGFKKDRISFNDILNNTNVDSYKNKMSLISVKIDLSQGDIRATGNQLDLAINGKGFFKVNTPEGIKYTRKGNFSLNPQGVLSTQDGYPVMGPGGPITVHGKEINIDAKGVLFSDGAQAGHIDLVDFEEYENLVKEGNGLFGILTTDPGKPVHPDTTIKQGFLELSNVNVAEEMIQMVHSLRAFESYQKAIKVLDEINNRAVNEVGRLR
ncbi:MAG: flagellar basal-body rod protein FlgF [Deltaproteobacteria bacterium]|nr:flagellar basal-body rod protein FlgF [Deltaproteobacteria bacterium]